MLEIISKIDEIDYMLRSNDFDNALTEIRILQGKTESSLPFILEQYQLRAPSAIIVGPARTATTWLRGVISKHPNVQVAHGEPNILCNISCGKIRSTLSWYGQSTIWKGTPKQNAIHCDKSPSYICLSDKDISVLAAFFPSLKIIVGLRNEKERLWSAIHHRMRDFSFRGEWMEFCRSHPLELAHHLDAGRTEHHISRWTKAFCKSNILRISFDLVNSSPDVVANSAISFLGVREISELPIHTKDKLLNRVFNREKKIILDDPPTDLFYIARSIIEDSRNVNSPT